MVPCFLSLKENAACDRLVERGNTSANTLCRWNIKRISDAQTEARLGTLTSPHTTERQELLALATRAGDWFRVTNGGGPMNCSDALLGHIMKTMDEDVVKLQKKRNECLKLAAVLGNEGRPYANWRNDEFKAAIVWKQGLKVLSSGEGVSGKTKPQLLKVLWEQKYRDMEASTDERTDEHEERLKRLSAGDISTEESAIYGDVKEQYIHVSASSNHL
jgi:hypothetical protein